MKRRKPKKGKRTTISLQRSKNLLPPSPDTHTTFPLLALQAVTLFSKRQLVSELISTHRVLQLVLLALLSFWLLLVPPPNSYAFVPKGVVGPALVTHANLAFVPEKYPQVDTSQVMPPFSAQKLLISTYPSTKILYSKNETDIFPPASLAKLMTAVVAQDYCNPETVLQTSISMPLEDEDSRMGLREGEHITYKNILYGLLLPSGNDAAQTIAAACNNGKDFVALMNQKATTIGLEHSTFTNPMGLDEPGNLTTAADLLVLTKQFLKNPLYREIVKTPTITVSNVEHTISHKLTSTNSLLFRNIGAEGVKTGTTDLAKQNLIALVALGDQRIVLVLLGSSDRFSDATRLIHWAQQSVVWKYPSPVPMYPID